MRNFGFRISDFGFSADARLAEWVEGWEFPDVGGWPVNPKSEIRNPKWVEG